MGLCLFEPLNAQVYYSTNKYYLKKKTEQNNLASFFEYRYPDTSIVSLDQFAPRNFMGNVGLPSPEYMLHYGTDDLGFRLYQLPLLNDRLYEKQVAYYKTKGPYAQLTGIAGEKQLQIFRMLYTQSYKEKVNITLRFNRYTSQGYYLKQQTYTNNFFASSNYTSGNGRTGYYLYLLNNGNRNQENGGIKDVRLSDSTMGLNKDLLAVRTYSASRDNRELKAMINPWFRLNKKTDSLGGVNHFIQLKSKLNISAYKYRNLALQREGYFNTFYVDSAATNDSSHVLQYSNEVDYTLRNNRNSMALSAGYRHEINRVWQKSDSLFMNHALQGDLFWSHIKRDPEDSILGRNYFQHINFQYIFKGPNAGNYKVEDNLLIYVDSLRRNALYVDFLAENRSPDYIYNYWNSNHYRWFNNGYKPQKTVEARAGFKLGRVLTLEAFYQNLFQYVYFDEYALPRQYDKTIENIGLSLGFTKVLFKHLGISLNHVYQSSSKPAYIRIPENVTTAKLFYHGIHFKKNLQIQIGSQVQVYQAFYGYNYAQSTQAFYLQNTYATAACPFVDVYINARIRPVSFFLKMENVLKGFVGNNYSFVPGYYQTDRAFRFGLTWVFFD